MALTLSQIVQATKTDTFLGVVNTYTNIPSLQVTITPSAITSQIWVMACVSFGASNGAQPAFFRITRNGTPLFLGDAASSRTQTSGAVGSYTQNNMGSSLTSANYLVNFIDSPNIVTALTYNIQMYGPGGSPIAINQYVNEANNNTYARQSSSLICINVPVP